MASNWKLRFFTIWIGQAFSLFGSSLAGFALIWWLTQETGSATVLAIGTLITLLPGVLIGPLAGTLVDRWNRRTIMIVADSSAALAALALVFLFWFGAITVWQIYLVMFIRSLAGAFHFPAMQASTSLMVPDEQLTRVAGMNHMLQGGSSIAAPALAALLIAFLLMSAMMLIDALTALVAVTTLALVQIPQPVRAATTEATSVVREMLDGLRYIWEWPGLRAVTIFATVLNLMLTPAFALLPILVTRHFEGGALDLAALQAVEGGGIIAGGVLLSIWGGFRRKILTSLSGLIGLGIGSLAVGLAPAGLFPLALIGMMIMGFTMPLTNGPFMAIVQSVVRPSMQGRVFTVIGSMAMGLAPLGLAVAGPIADSFGVQIWYLIGAIATFVILIIFVTTPAIMQIEDRRDTGDPVSEEPAPNFQKHVVS
ncbi:MAG TPA: MFS transporter [Roseiflexaceae bacterium]|nr:MFS transporter [Roseiflexaceae bacterium]